MDAYKYGETKPPTSPQAPETGGRFIAPRRGVNMKHETDPLGDSDDAVGFFLFLAVVTWPIVTFVLTSHVTLTQAAVLAVPVALVCAVLFLPSIMLIGMSMVAGLFYACILFIRFVLTYL